MNNFLKALTRNVTDFINHESVEQDIAMISRELASQAFKDIEPLIEKKISELVSVQDVETLIEKRISESVNTQEIKAEPSSELCLISKIYNKKTIIEQQIDTIDREICYHIVKKDISDESMMQMKDELDDKKSDLLLIKKLISILE